MSEKKHFYAVIIGSEILQNRRQDAHFTFIRDALLEKNYELYSVHIIKDDPILIKNTFKQVLNDPNSVLFSFGGIGSTPDDLTRHIAAEVFTQEATQRHKTFERDIITRFGDAAYPHRIHMADIPKGSDLLFNPVNNMSGFHLKGRYFFMPGFPEMAHPMVLQALDTFYPKQTQALSFTITVYASEDKLISYMKDLDASIELSCLPMMNNGKPQAELTLQTHHKQSLDKAISDLMTYLDAATLAYQISK